MLLRQFGWLVGCLVNGFGEFPFTQNSIRFLFLYHFVVRAVSQPVFLLCNETHVNLGTSVARQRILHCECEYKKAGI